MSSSERNIPSTADATAAQAQSREGKSTATLPPLQQGSSFAAGQYVLGEDVTRADRVVPYQRKPADPVYRPLRIFTRDPATSLRSGSIALINLPYEPLDKGPEGSLLKIEDSQPFLDLEEHSILIETGVTPSVSDPRFRAQMTYAVCSAVYASFRAALGRSVAWGFDNRQDNTGPLKLTIRPAAFDGPNAYYENQDGTLNFGYYKADKAKTIGNNLPGGEFYTCFSHDIVAHEMTHALLDGLRANFTIPCGRDVLAFHEAFADLIAIFQRFSYKEVLHSAIRQAGPSLGKSELLTSIAEQFGQTTTGHTCLRSAIDIPEPGEAPKLYEQETEPHALGSVLVSAVFEAFVTVFQRKVQTFLRLASGGSGILSPGELSADLIEVLAKSASHLASQFLSILIRSIDYCPPVDIRFGDFLRAMITADHDLVPDDPYAYREALIDAFRRRAIFPVNVESLSEDSLVWRQPRRPIGEITSLNFANLRFRGDPQNPAGAKELLRQARCLGDAICDPSTLLEFGLVSQGEAAGQGLEVDLPCIHSIRSSRRVGPDGQVIFDLVAEVTQCQMVTRDGRGVPFYGGSTIILGPGGEVRYVISKSVLSESRMQDQMEFIASDAGKRFWEETGRGFVARRNTFRLLHD